MKTQVRPSPEELDTMNTYQITESFSKRAYEIQEELQSVAEGAQLIIDNTGVYLTLRDVIIKIEAPADDEDTARNNDALLPYVMDATTAPREEYDLTSTISDQDIEGLSAIAADPTLGSGQRINAYQRLGNYVHDAQEERTAASVKQELQERSRQNGRRVHQISLRARTLLQRIGEPYPRKFCRITPDWMYKLPKPEFERFLRLCNEVHSQVLEEIMEANLWSQELPSEGGNVCGGTNVTGITGDEGGVIVPLFG